MNIVFWILAILFSLGMGYWVYRADVKRAVPHPWLTALLRTIVIFLSCLLLLTPFLHITKNKTQKPIIVFLQDNSASIAANLSGDSIRYKKDATNLLNKLSKDYRVIEWGFGASIQKDSLFDYRQPATHISHALREAVEYYGQQNLGAIILATDGRYNEGSNPEYEELNFQGSIYTIGIGDTSIQKDIRIGKIYANKTVSIHNQFEIRADIIATMAEGYSGPVQLSEAGKGVLNNVSLHVNSANFDGSVSFSVMANTAGLHHYILTAPAIIGENNTHNNRKDVFVEVVSEKKKILLAAAAPHPDVQAIRAAIKGLEHYDLHVHTAENFPTNINDYDVLILHGLPSNSFKIPLDKPTWYIISQGTNTNAIPPTLANFKLNTAALQNNFVQANNSFRLFTLPKNTWAVMDKMPPLASPVGEIQPGINTEILLESKSKKPLWMLQQGRTPQALVLGEGIWRWRMYEYRFFHSHDVVDEMIRQTLSFLTTNVSDQPFEVSLPKNIWNDRESITLNAYLLNANNEQVNTPDATLTLTDSSGNKETFSFEKSGNAYQLRLGNRPAGTYRYTAQTNYNGKDYTASGSFMVENIPVEMLQTGSDYRLLHNLADNYAGHFFSATDLKALYDSIHRNELIKPVIQTTDETIPLIDWKWFFFLILLLAAIEWTLRKYWMAQ